MMPCAWDVPCDGLYEAVAVRKVVADEPPAGLQYAPDLAETRELVTTELSHVFEYPDGRNRVERLIGEWEQDRIARIALDESVGLVRDPVAEYAWPQIESGSAIATANQKIGEVASPCAPVQHIRSRADVLSKEGVKTSVLVCSDETAEVDQPLGALLRPLDQIS
jgi:hypothetical protein